VAQKLFFWLFVTEMRGRRDDDVRLRRLFVGKRCRCGVRRSPRSCKMILLISPCPIWRWRRRMVMLDTKLYLVSVVWFLRRSRVDCGTEGSTVVVGNDSSKRKVTIAYTTWSLHCVCEHKLEILLCEWHCVCTIWGWHCMWTQLGRHNEDTQVDIS
jgi:hypothetical protein